MNDIAIDPKCVTILPHAETKLRSAVFQALGYASACWDGDGVFQSELASECGETLVSEILDLTALGEPSLGCATTDELEAELKARYSMGNLGDYRTVNG